MDDLTKQVLDWVNSVRERYDAPTLADLAQGKVAEAENCPISNSLVGGKVKAACVYASFFLYRKPITLRSLSRGDSLLESEEAPDHVFKWIKQFDAGYYEEYNARDRS